MDISIARSAVESLYLDRATIIEYQSVFNTEDCSTGIQELVVCENQPCKVSHVSARQAYDGVASDDIRLITKLFISPDINVKPGSKIILDRNGVETVYRNSGEPSMYYNHQEIIIETWETDA